ncbi:hypothetical protein ACFPZ0_10875 [Streptomonospora nanhaiensis]|uniref:hypothetical protein n=1 Tax=Streptomonospora nanhaiensis TaxID=1323731 RepID=UPI001C392B0F|nr:hypothetical protein [Streptomonospora nanhaiensis]MBX9387652.1 hypothetical protein [Streptomonospora nanhaiensis]
MNPNFDCYRYGDHPPILVIDQGEVHAIVTPAARVITQEDVEVARSAVEAAKAYFEEMKRLHAAPRAGD